MKKIIFRSFLIIIALAIGSIFYLSVFGIKTSKFNSIIISEIKKKEPNIEYIQTLLMLESYLPSSDFFKIIEASTFSSRVTPWLTRLGKQESNTEKVGILVIDSDKFDKEAPVPQAIAAVLAFQDCMLCDDAIVIVAHSPAGGISLDMMLIPQLTMMNAKEIYRSDYAAWKLSKSV